MNQATLEDFTRAFEREFGEDKRQVAMDRPFLKRADAWQDAICIGFVQSNCSGLVYRRQSNQLEASLEIDSLARPTIETETVIAGIAAALERLGLSAHLRLVEVKSVGDTQPFLEGRSTRWIHLRDGLEPIGAALVGVFWVVVGAFVLWDDQSTTLIAGAIPGWALGGFAVAKALVRWRRWKVIWTPAGL